MQNVPVVVTNPNGQTVSRSDLLTYYELLASTGWQPIDVAVGDFNGDSNPDVATANQDSKDVSILLGDGRGKFAAAKTVDLASTPTALLTNDFHGDGIADLAVLSYEAASEAWRLGIILGSTTGALSAKTIMMNSSITYYGMTTADLNKDGKADLIVTAIAGIN